MSSITVLGAGSVGTALATALAQNGREVVLGVRDTERVRAAWTGPAVTVLDVPAAIGRSDLILNATPGESSLERFGALEEELAGKTLVDVSNATTRSSDGLPGGALYTGSSLGERLQSALPRTHVVKTLNTMLFSAMVAPASLKSAPTVFLSGDDSAAKDRVRGLLADLGWDEEWMLDLGGIETAQGTEAMATVATSVLKTIGFVPFAVSIAR